MIKYRSIFKKLIFYATAILLIIVVVEGGLRAIMLISPKSKEVFKGIKHVKRDKTLGYRPNPVSVFTCPLHLLH